MLALLQGVAEHLQGPGQPLGRSFRCMSYNILANEYVSGSVGTCVAANESEARGNVAGEVVVGVQPPSHFHTCCQCDLGVATSPGAEASVASGRLDHRGFAIQQ